MTMQHEPVILRGWEAIGTAAGGMGKREMRRLMDDSGFPVTYAGKMPITTPELLREWVKGMVQDPNRPARPAGEGCSDSV